MSVGVGAALTSVLLLGNATFAATTSHASKPKHGGTLTVVVSSGAQSTWPTLDPVSAGGGNNQDPLVMDDLIKAVPGQGQFIGVLASHWAFSKNNLQFRLFLKHGITFTDGTPFNAAAVQWNWQRDLNPANACACLASFNTVTSVTTNGNYEVDLNFSSAFAPVLAAIGAMNYIQSPTNFNTVGATAAGQKPVGAGPYLIQSNVPSSKIVWTRNPAYFQKGLPYLDSIIFEVSGTDPSAYATLQSGQAQFAEAIGTASIIKAARDAGPFAVRNFPTVTEWGFWFNTFNPPFNNILAREAVAYATDNAGIDKALYFNLNKPAQTPTGSASFFYEAKVPGFRSYNIAKAKALVQQIGGIPPFYCVTGSQAQELYIYEAAEQTWAQAGIKCSSIFGSGLPGLNAAMQAHQEGMALLFTGGLDASVSMRTEVSPGLPENTVNDPKLTTLMIRAAGITNPKARAGIFRELFAYINKMEYVHVLFTNTIYIVYSNQVGGADQKIGVTYWPTVYLK